MTTHKVVFAKLGDLATHQVFQVVNDWAISGLVSDSIWIDVDNTKEMAFLTSKGLERVGTNEWLSAGIQPGDDISSFSFQIFRDSKNVLTFENLEFALASHPLLNKSSGQLVNVVVPASDLTGLPSDAFFDFRLNVVVAPVDGMAPKMGHNLITKKSPEMFSHAAAGIVSIAGFWHGQKNSPVAGVGKGRSFGPSQNTLLSRSFVRYVDASDLVRDLVNSVGLTDPSSLPVAVNEKGVPLEILMSAHAPTRIEQVAQDFIKVNNGQLTYKAPPQFRSGALKSIAFSDAVKLYFSWVFKWWRAAPGEWAQEKLATAKKAIAESGQRFLGSDSQYEVIVKGVSSRSHEGNADLNLGQEILDAAKAGMGSGNAANPASPHKLWESMVSVSCNLVDGGTGTEEVPLPAAVGGDREVVVEPKLVTPDSTKNFFDVPATLPIAMTGTRLYSDDPYAAFVVLDQIEIALKNSGEISAVKFNELNQLKLDVENWISKNKSFTWQVGQKIAQEMHQARVHSRAMYEVASSLEAGFDLVEAEAKARKALWNVVKGGAIILLTGGAIWLVQAIMLAITTGVWPVLSATWFVPALIAAAVLLVWNIVGIAAFVSAAGEFFNLERRINEQKARARWAKDNINGVLQELHRLASYYGQYRLWVKVMSPIFHREIVEVKTTAVDKVSIKGLSDLPKSVVVAELSPTKEAREELFSKVRNSFYKRGWLKTALDKYIVARGLNLNEIWGDLGHSVNSDLVKLSNLSADGQTATLLAELAGSSAKDLATQGSNYQHWTVRTKDAKFAKETEGSQFVDAIRAGEESIPIGELLNAKSNVQGSANVSKSDSYLGLDDRLSAETDVANVEKLSSSSLEIRSLDFMAVRLELTSPGPSDIFTFVKAKTRAAATESVSIQDDVEG